MKVIRERILNAVHKCLQWENGEIAGIDMLKLEQRIDGILEQLNKPVVSGKRPTEFTIEEVIESIKTLWIKDFGRLDSNSPDRDGYFVCGFVHEALKAACASGGVDKTVSGGDNLEQKKYYNAGYKPGMEQHEG